jgi:acyl-CoA synthetase (NDP forming)
MNQDIVDQLAPLFYPRSIALVGVSDRLGNQGYMYLHSLLTVGFSRVYPVNPKGGELLGLKVYPSVKSIPEEVDLAILTVPREAVPEIARECAQKGTKGMVLYSAGFAEVGSGGAELQEEIVRIAREGGTRVIGPNSVGTYNPSAKLVTQSVLPRDGGPVGVISHSGFLLSHLLMAVAHRGLSAGKGVSSGSDCDLTCVDFLEYLGQDPEIKIIAAYLEGIREGNRFLRVAREISQHKPIVVLKGGDTDAGRIRVMPNLVPDEVVEGHGLLSSVSRPLARASALSRAESASTSTTSVHSKYLAIPVIVDSHTLNPFYT